MEQRRQDCRFLQMATLDEEVPGDLELPHVNAGQHVIKLLFDKAGRPCETSVLSL